MTEKTEWQRGYDEGRRMGSKNRQDELDQLKAENAGLQTGFKAYEATVQELKGEIEALCKDAERYRFLRDQPSCYMHTEGWQIRRHWRDRIDSGRPNGMMTMCVTGESLDGRIDAAMSNGEKP